MSKTGKMQQIYSQAAKILRGRSLFWKCQDFGSACYCSSYLRRSKVFVAVIIIIKKTNNVIIITVILSCLKKEIKVRQVPLMWQASQFDSKPTLSLQNLKTKLFLCGM